MRRSSLTELLADLRSKDVKLSVDGDRLRCDAPKGVMTSELQQQLVGRKAELIAFLRAARREAPELPPLEPQSLDGQIPLSFAQEGAWFINQLQPDVPFNIVWPVRLEGQLDLGALRLALNEIARRHSVLRTTFEAVDGRPYQRIHASWGLPLSFVDLSTLPGSSRDEQLLGSAMRLAQKTFDLAKGPLTQMTVFRLAEEDNLLLLIVHHSVFDGWSVKLFAQELSALYGALRTGRTPMLPTLPVQYADYAIWHRQLLTGDFYDQQLRYWKDRLADYPSGLALPFDYRPSAGKLFQGHLLKQVMGGQLGRSLRALAQREGVTLFMLLTAAFKTLLMRYTEQEDLIVGTPVATRSQPQLADVIGFCVNVLALRTDLSGNPSFRELLKRERDVCLGAFSHQELPFGKLVQELDPVRSVSHSPIFQVQIALQEGQGSLDLIGLREVPLFRSSEPKEDLLSVAARAQPATDYLFLTAVETGEDLLCFIHYRADLFEPASIERMLIHFERLLRAAVENPERRIRELPILSEDERRQLLDAWSSGGPASSDHLAAHQFFELQAEKTPDSVALLIPSEDGRAPDELRISYGELNRRANQLAHYLLTRGVGDEERVAICLDRSVEQIVGVWGVLKAGAAFVPLDPDYGTERFERMLRDSQATLLITRRGLLDDSITAGVPVIDIDEESAAIGSQCDTNPEIPIEDDQLAYILYTSGSTGRPKGVMVSHRSLVNAYRSWETAYGLRDVECHLQMASFSFDVFVGDLVRALCSGARLVLCPRGSLLVPEELISIIRRYRVEAAEFVPAVVRGLLEHLRERAERLDGLKLAMVGSDTWYSFEYNQARALFGEGARLINSYGVAEATIDSSYFESSQVIAGDRSLPIGRPFPGTDMFVLDALMEPVPVGVPGTLYLGGAGLARGYLDQPGLTAARFVPNPFSKTAGERLYNTGDRARLQDDGTIQLIGRVDDQIKVRGFRIEPGEIENVLGEHEDVRQAVVVGDDERTGDKRLVAYVTAARDAKVSAESLRRYLQGKLPNYMIPSQFVTLDDLPLTPSGKVNRRALPAPPAPDRDIGAQYQPPRTLVEWELSRIWAEVLGVNRVSVHDDFFALGGHSLLAARLIARVRRDLKVDLPLRSVFENPTVALLSRAVEASDQSRAAALPPIEPVPRVSHMPLSYAQEGAWFVDQLQRGTPFNIPMLSYVAGKLDVDCLKKALVRVVQRHEALRTAFGDADGEPYQIIYESVAADIETVDLRHLPEPDRKPALFGHVIDRAASPFDLYAAPLFRMTVFTLHDDEHVLLFNVHHIVFDGHSAGVLARDLSAYYDVEQNGGSVSLPALSVQYADYAVWQRKVLTGDFLESELEYWRTQLADCPSGLNLPVDPAKRDAELFRGDTVTAVLAAPLSASLRSLCQREGTTLFMLLLAAYKSLLTRYTGQEDIVVGTPIANRNQHEMADVIGFCVNMLALRTQCSGNPTFRQLLQREREVCLGAFAHQEVPLGLLVQDLQPERYVSHSPFFSVGFGLQTASSGQTGVPNLSLSQLSGDLDLLLAELEKRRADTTPATDLMFLQITDTGGEIAAVMQHNSALFSPTTVDRMMRHLETLLERIAENPDTHLFDIPLLDEDERRRILVDFNATDLEHDSGLALHELFERQAELRPDEGAVVVLPPPGIGQEDEEVTYADLNRRANQLARYLVAQGVGPESRVGICLERSVDMVAAMWAVLKAGAAYVPLDQANGQERLQYMLEDSSVELVITHRDLIPSNLAKRVIDLDGQREQIDLQADGNLNLQVDDRQLAYLIYTSGSSGRPKGVMVAHRGLVNAYYAWEKAYRLEGLGCHLQMASFSFDVFAGDVIRALASGAKLVLCPRESLLVPHELADLMRRHKVECAEFVPAVVRPLMEHLTATGETLEDLRLMVVGSDVWYLSEYQQLKQLLGERVRLVNSYGVAEATIDSTYFEAGELDLSGDALVPIGRPFGNIRTYVLDPYLNPVPLGAAGELYIAGEGLARGYSDHPEMTAERFVPDPFGDTPGGRLYRTGDRARYLSDGNLAFLGRADNQIKIRGFRIEPAEIEAALCRYPLASQAVVVADEGRGGETRLVAYVCPVQDGELKPSELRDFLDRELPTYMVPSVFMILDRLPLTRSGKLDRRALPDPWAVRADVAEYVAPRTPTESRLAMLWQEVLGVEQVGVNDSFFALGGHSLVAARLVARVRMELGVNLPLRALFEHPTVAGLARTIDMGLMVDAALEAEVDLPGEAVLSGDVTVTKALAPAPGEPQNILLTGATGFIGKYLLRALLDHTTANIYCLVRGKDVEEAARRLKGGLEAWGLWDESLSTRIVPVLGDLAKPRLGVQDDEHYHFLAATVDVIYHNAAWVNSLYPYAMLKDTNVGGSEEILRLACRTKLKPVHHISTLSVFPPNRWASGEVAEIFRQESYDGLKGGYAQSKWVAEQLMNLAADRGVPVTIYRPGRVTGDSRTGATSETLEIDHLNELLELGTIPRIDGPTRIDIVPVDYVADAIVHLSRKPGTIGKAFHLVNPAPGSWDDVGSAFRRAGYELREVDARRWVADFYRQIRRTRWAALQEVIPLVPPQVIELLEQLTSETEIREARPEPNPSFQTAGKAPPVSAGADCRNTVAALADTQVACPPVAQLLDVYVAYLIRERGLRPPSHPALSG